MPCLFTTTIKNADRSLPYFLSSVCISSMELGKFIHEIHNSRMNYINRRALKINYCTHDTMDMHCDGYLNEYHVLVIKTCL